MFDRKTLPDLFSAISSPASADGRLPPDSPDGRKIGNCGQAPHHANRSALPGSSAAPTTSAICGRNCSDLSPSESLRHSWANRLRQRLERIGSTECFLTWKESATPAGRPLSRLVPSTPRTVVTVCGLSPNEAALWITASARDWKDSPGMASTRADGRSRIDQLPRQVAAAMWPTAQCRAKGGGEYADPEKARARMASGHQVNLPDAVKAHGPHTTGSSDTTAKRGASPSLNPAFVCWLMGFPPAWDACAPTAMPSSRKSLPK